MAYNRLKLVTSENANSTILRYENTLADAERAYMFGQQERAQTLYRSAFELSIELLNSKTANHISFQRLIDACELCFDHCPLLQDTDEHYFLEIAAEALEEIITSQANKRVVRMQALMTYSGIANLARELVCHSQSERAQSVVRCYQRLRAIHEYTLYQSPC